MFHQKCEIEKEIRKNLFSVIPKLILKHEWEIPFKKWNSCK